MEFAEAALALLAVVVAVTAGCRRLNLSAPLILTGIGAAVSFVPAMPEVHVEPHVVLLGFLPPLLYAAAVNTSLIDLGRERRPIIGLSVFLVLATAFAVGLVTWGLIAAVPFAIALALGGVVAPPDAVAATAVARRIGLPRRIVSILEGESLFNDATALVIVSLAIEAAAHEVTGLDVLVSFLRSALGGVLIGFVAYKLIRLVRRRITDTITNVAISFMTPWVAYIPAELVHSSGVVATVVAGVLLAHTAPTDQTASARVAERMNWATIQFILENLVFLLIGLQARTILDEMRDSPLGLGRSVLVAFAVLATVMVVRPIWLLLWAWVGRLRSSEQSLSLRESAVASWAGMRGVVTLAAASLLPLDAPERGVLVFTALVVTVGTLVLQGFTLGKVARALDLHGPDPREDALQFAQMLQMAVSAGNRKLDEEIATGQVPEPVVAALRAQGERRTNLAWERLGSNDSCEQTPSEQYRQLRGAMLEAERAKVLKLRDKGAIDHEVMTQIMESLDVEESMIARIESRDEQDAERLLLTPERRQFGCDDLNAAPASIEPLTHDGGCPDCALEGLTPVHLRLCLSCGYVGCCDSSEGKHMSRHHEQVGHPVMRSFEPGEAWRWCFVHELLG